MPNIPFDPGEDAAVRRSLETLASQGVAAASIQAVGHRVVHDGGRFVRPTVVDNALLQTIGELGSLAPLHNPVAARVIATARSALSGRPHVAVFDTAFRPDPGDLGLVVAHLGAGCSVTAVWARESVNTSMGMTPLEEVVMATRACAC